LETQAGTFVSAKAGFVILSVRRFCVENLSGEPVASASNTQETIKHLIKGVMTQVRATRKRRRFSIKYPIS
jgi:hypothetical protein